MGAYFIYFKIGIDIAITFYILISCNLIFLIKKSVAFSLNNRSYKCIYLNCETETQNSLKRFVLIVNNMILQKIGKENVRFQIAISNWPKKKKTLEIQRSL